MVYENAFSPKISSRSQNQLMKPETKKILLSYDDDQAWEFPHDFNSKDIEKRARQVYAELCDKVREPVKFEDWIYNQDASFGLAIVFDPHKHKKSTNIRQLVIRFSNFGNLATFSYAGKSLTSTNQTIIESLSRNGFIYVDSSELEEPYDGVMAPNKTISTWWIRYFDWL